MSDVNFVIEQIEDEKDAWKKDHDSAMQCRDLEDFIRLGITFYYMIRTADEIWSRKVQSRAIPFDARRAREFHELYEWWIEPCDEVLSRIVEAERVYGSVDGAADFRKAQAQVRAFLRVPMERIEDGLKHLVA